MRKVLKIVNKLGIHARPAAVLVKIANAYDCDVFFEKDGMRVNGKSVLDLMILAAPKGTEISVETVGEGEKECMGEIEEIFARGFDEEIE
ncbi:HPr family phosphocarrier protein [candidate division WOR-3 bacterium]|nr:HPr family phosphocarrier protein [candidate division WOR-3 bacterium]